jgi:phosphate transport system substrate-binding protein
MKLTLLLSSLFLAAAPLLAADAPPPDSAAEHALQHASRSNKAFYPPRFDLSGLPHYKPEQVVTGTLRIFGNNYIGDSELGNWWRDAFRKFHPGVKFEYNLPSAAIAVPALYFGLADIGMNHEPHFYDHLSYLRMMGYAPTGISVVTGSYDVAGWQDSIVIAVRKSNPLSSVTMEQLDGIFGSVRDGGWVGANWHPEVARGEEKDIRKWGQLGVTGELADQRIHVYGYTPRYATALEFSNRVLGGSDKWNGDLRAFGNWRRPDGTIYGQADQILDHLKADPAGIAIIRYAPGFPKDLKVLAIAKDASSAPIPYTIDTVQSRSYPLWSDQSFWINRKPGEPIDPKVKEFVRFVLSQEGQALVQKDGKYLPLTAAVAAEELKKLN